MMTAQKNAVSSAGKMLVRQLQQAPQQALNTHRLFS